MSSGWAPPESGPARDRYLRENGERLLAGTRAAFDAVVEVVVDRSNPTCNACFEESCDHRDGDTVLAPARNMAVSFQATGIATVARPRDPLARVEVLSLGQITDPEYLAAAESGELRCSECILPCQGFRTPEGLS